MFYFLANKIDKLINFDFLELAKLIAWELR